jgi:hypothetical protein
MVKGETVMPTPEGVINTSQFWSGDNGSSNQDIEETQEEQVQEEVNTTEQAVVEGDSDL